MNANIQCHSWKYWRAWGHGCVYIAMHVKIIYTCMCVHSAADCNQVYPQFSYNFSLPQLLKIIYNMLSLFLIYIIIWGRPSTEAFNINNIIISII